MVRTGMVDFIAAANLIASTKPIRAVLELSGTMFGHGGRAASAIARRWLALGSELNDAAARKPPRYCGCRIVELYHPGRNHQGLRNQLIQPEQKSLGVGASVCRRKRLGGMLSFYYSAA